MPNTADFFISYLPFFLMMFATGSIAYYLAKDKGRSPWEWAILGAIPGINVAAFIFLVGATNLRLERKLDLILEELKNQPRT